MITEAMENTFVNKVKAFMHQFKRVGAGHWTHDTKSKLFDFKYDKGTRTLTINAVNKKDGKSEQKSFKDDSYGLIKFMGTLFDSTGTLTEEATAGATCAANVATISQPIGSTVKRKKKKEPRFDVEMFKKSIKEDTPCACKINGKKLRYEISEGSGFLYVDNSIAKLLLKKDIIECVDNLYYNDRIDVDLLEGYSANELVTLICEDLVSPEGLDTDDTDDIKQFTPEDEEEINDMRANPTQTLNVIDDETKQVVPQQFDGVDDIHHKIILKDPTRPEVKRTVSLRSIVKDKNEAV